MKRLRRLLPLLLVLLLVEPVSAASAASGLEPALHRQLKEIGAQMDAGAYAKSVKRLKQLSLDYAKADHYSIAVILQYLGYAHLGRDDYASARKAFRAALTHLSLPLQVTAEIHRLLAQLGLQLNRPKEAVKYLDLWLKGRKSLKPPRSLKLSERLMAAQIYHAAGKLKRAIPQLEKAVAAVARPKESWQRSLLSMYLEARRYKQARKLLQRLIGRYPDKVYYWRQLAQMQLRLGQEEKALAVLALAYQKGLLEAKELVRFAGLHAHAGMPDKAARLLREWRRSGKLRTTRKLLLTEADLWSLARERKTALELLRLAHKRSKDGAPALKEGQILFQEGRWSEAASALDRALAKGGLKQPNRAQLLLGVAAYRSGELERAKAALEQAASSEATSEQARQWLSAVARDSGEER